MRGVWELVICSVSKRLAGRYEKCSMKCKQGAKGRTYYRTKGNF